MGTRWTPVVAVCGGLHLHFSHFFHSAAHENITSATLLSFWKLSFLEPSDGEDDKVQANVGRRRPHLPQEKELYVGKISTAGRVQKKRLQKYLQHEKEVEDEEEKEVVRLEEIGVSGKGSDKKHYRSYLKSFSFLALLKACATEKDLRRGRDLHAHIVSRGFFKNTSIMAILMSMYSKCGAPEMAQDLFDETRFRNVFSWNALMDVYIQRGHAYLVLTCFQQMQQECVFPDAVTCTYILKACGTLGVLKKGQEVHVQLASNRFLERDNIVGTALVNMYAKYGSFIEAEEVFDKLVVRDVVSWNALISGYARHRYDAGAIKHFERMRYEGFSPNAITFICILKACASLGVSFKGQAIHAEILRTGLLAEAKVGNVLLNMYAKSGILAKAQEVFNGLSIHDVVSWSTLVTGFALHSHPEEALERLEEMEQEGRSPNRVTFLCILRACGSTGALNKGQAVHAKITKEGWLTKDVRIANALVDMYAKCGVLSKAHGVFDELPAQSVVLWTALIAGYSQAGKVDVAFELFNTMIGEGKEPDLITFTTLLNACSSGGLLEEGQMFFEVLRGHHGMIPTREHFTRMVDLFGRAGDLQKAVTLISRLPFSADGAMWHSLMGACQKWGNANVGRWAFQHAVQLNEQDASAYAIMTNIHQAGRMHQYHGPPKGNYDANET